MFLRSVLLCFAMLMSYHAMSLIEYKRIETPNQNPDTAEQLAFSHGAANDLRIFQHRNWSSGQELLNYGAFDIPNYRKYQNKHIAPTRMWVGGGMVAAGGIMMIMGHRQDNKYEWSGPYPTVSPLNVFGALVIAAGIGFIVSGLLFHAKFKKHTITPYHKAY